MSFSNLLGLLPCLLSWLIHLVAINRLEACLPCFLNIMSIDATGFDASSGGYFEKLFVGMTCKHTNNQSNKQTSLKLQRNFNLFQD